MARAGPLSDDCPVSFAQTEATHNAAALRRCANPPSFFTLTLLSHATRVSSCENVAAVRSSQPFSEAIGQLGMVRRRAIAGANGDRSYRSERSRPTASGASRRAAPRLGQRYPL